MFDIIDKISNLKERGISNCLFVIYVVFSIDIVCLNHYKSNIFSKYLELLNNPIIVVICIVGIYLFLLFSYFIRIFASTAFMNFFELKDEFNDSYYTLSQLLSEAINENNSVKENTYLREKSKFENYNNIKNYGFGLIIVIIWNAFYSESIMKIFYQKYEYLSICFIMSLVFLLVYSLYEEYRDNSKTSIYKLKKELPSTINDN
jgi:hypothetical protein